MKVRLSEVLFREDVQNLRVQDLEYVSPEFLVEIYTGLRTAGINSFELASMVDPRKVPVQKIFGSSDSVRTYIGGKKIETNIGIMRSGEAIWVSNAGALMPRVTQPHNSCYT